MGSPIDPVAAGVVQRAVLSVNYHSRATQLELRGASAILLPPELEPMPLDDALEILYEKPGRRREAAWTLIRNSSPPPVGATEETRKRTFPQRYSWALQRFARRLGFDLFKFDACRQECRRGARWFAAGLFAYAEGDKELATTLAEKLPESEFSKTVTATGALGTGDITRTPEGWLLTIMDPASHGDELTAMTEAANMIRGLEQEVALDLGTFINEFADTVAFMRFWEQAAEESKQPLTVFPTSTVVVQDPATLTTTVTGTSLVRTKDFDAIARSIDPRRWRHYGSIFKTARYIGDAFDLDPLDPPNPVGTTLAEPPGLVEEEIKILSGLDGGDVGYFHNVISIDRFEVNRGEDVRGGSRRADLEFSLHRSIDSRFLWDVRPGGILFDSGWTRVTCVTSGAWRMTSRKMIRFTDRTQYTGWDGPQDFGQAMNYLAPAVLSAWMESDMYSGERPAVHGPEPEPTGGA